MSTFGDPYEGLNLTFSSTFFDDKNLYNQSYKSIDNESNTIMTKNY